MTELESLALLIANLNTNIRGLQEGLEQRDRMIESMQEQHAEALREQRETIKELTEVQESVSAQDDE